MPRQRLSRVERRVRHLASSALQLPASELAAAAHAAAVLVAVEVMLRLVPLTALARMLGLRVDIGPQEPNRAALDLATLPLRAQRRLAAARRVTDVWPTRPGPCLRRALVGGHLVRELDPALRIGLMGSSGSTLAAHAWLEVGGRPLEQVATYRAFARGGACQ